MSTPTRDELRAAYAKLLFDDVPSEKLTMLLKRIDPRTFQPHGWDAVRAFTGHIITTAEAAAGILPWCLDALVVIDRALRSQVYLGGAAPCVADVVIYLAARPAVAAMDERQRWALCSVSRWVDQMQVCARARACVCVRARASVCARVCARCARHPPHAPALALTLRAPPRARAPRAGRQHLVLGSADERAMPPPPAGMPPPLRISFNYDMPDTPVPLVLRRPDGSLVSLEGSVVEPSSAATGGGSAAGPPPPADGGADGADEKKLTNRKEKNKEKKEKKEKAAPPKPAEPAAAEQSPISRIDIRVGVVLEAERHPEADSLYVEKVGACGAGAGRRGRGPARAGGRVGGRVRGAGAGRGARARPRCARSLRRPSSIDRVLVSSAAS